MSELTPALFPRDYAPIERWLPVVGWEGSYEVSDIGRVRSLDRVITDEFPGGRVRRRRWRGRIRKPAIDEHGYLYVILSADSNQQRFGVHRLVGEAFVGPLPPGMETRHMDGNPANNAVSNLRYGTHAENMLDKRIHGTDYNSNKTHCPQGHEYTEENTCVFSDGLRRCRICRADRQRARRARRQAARKAVA